MAITQTQRDLLHGNAGELDAVVRYITGHVAGATGGDTTDFPLTNAGFVKARGGQPDVNAGTRTEFLAALKAAVDDIQP